MITSVLLRSVLAGCVALAVNFAVLHIADRLGIVTARGGFQRLVKLRTGPLLIRSGVGRVWSSFGLPTPHSAAFTVGFKVGVGLFMAFAYGLLEPHVPGPALAKGLFYAALIWLINAGLVMPALGEGFAGSKSLTGFGMATFAVAHTSFFIVLCVLLTPARIG